MPAPVLLVGVALGLPVLVLGTAAMLERLVRRPEWGAGMVMGLVVVVTGFGEILPPIDTGAFVIIYSDVTSVLLIGAGLMRILRRRKQSIPTQLMLPFMALVLWSIYRGGAAGMVNEALHESRNFLAYGGAILYFSTFRLSAEEREAIGRVWLIGAIGFLVITGFRWVGLVAGVEQTGIWARPQEPGSVRVIDGRNALVLLQALVIVVPAWVDGRARGWEKRLAVVSLLVVVLMQHRTVWITLLVAGLIAAARDPRLGRPLVAGFAVLVLFGSLALVKLDNGGAVPTAAEGTNAFVPRSPADTGSFEWRSQGWLYLLTNDQPSDPPEMLFGEPFGGGYPRLLDNGNIVDTVPHNFYIESYLRVGLLGLGLLLFLLAVGALRLSGPGRYARDGRLMTSETLFILLVTHAVHSLAWSPDWEQGVLVGVATSVAWGARRAAPGPRPGRPGGRGTVRAETRGRVLQRA